MCVANLLSHINRCNTVQTNGFSEPSQQTKGLNQVFNSFAFKAVVFLTFIFITGCQTGNNNVSDKKRMSWAEKAVMLSEGNTTYVHGLREFELKNYKAAKEIWTPLAERNDPVRKGPLQFGDQYAQVGLGTIYFYGFGVKRDYNLAYKWIKMSAEHNNREAQHFLGLMYSLGRGVDQDNAEAFYWLRTSASNGSSGAAMLLGTIYLGNPKLMGDPKGMDGETTKSLEEIIQKTTSLRNKINAYKWFYIGARLAKVKLNSEAIRLIETGMSSAQKREAKTQAEKWLANN
jgi:TPR repeat protein